MSDLKRQRRMWQILLTIMIGFTALGLLAGCSVIRGIPTHGGGKRFDEEQRIVSGAIRRAIADMDLRELSGKTVQPQIQSIAHSGGGAETYPGVNSLTAGYNYANSNGATLYPQHLLLPDGSTAQDNLTDSLAKGWALSATANPTHTYNSSTFASDTDLDYLTAAVTMKLYHTACPSVAESPEVLLFVMVDVLGLNRSRRDSVVVWRDDLEASCEITYYAIDAATRQLLFRARHTSARALYTEHSALFCAAYQIDRAIERSAPTPFPIDGYAPDLESPDDDVTTLTTAVTAPPARLRQPRREFIDTQLRGADLAVQRGDFGQAHRLIEAARAVDPSFPGLADVEDRLRRAEQRRQQQAPTILPRPFPLNRPGTPGNP